jgi:hypothetical protein
MEKMATMLTAPTSASTVPQNEYVAKRLDQLEDLGKYSVIYEIARIETILGHTFMDGAVPRTNGEFWF